MPTMNLKAYIFALNELLQSRGIIAEACPEDFHILSEVVIEAFKSNRVISDALSTSVSPPIHNGTFYHYCDAKSAENILRTNNLHLTTIKKRIFQGEISTFLKLFEFDYPLENNPATGRPRFHEYIANEIFYISLANTYLPPDSDQHNWDEFAKSNGARFKFSIETQTGCLRQIVYKVEMCKWAQLFSEIQTVTKKHLGRKFFWADVCAMSALCLPDFMNIEDEVRLLTRAQSSLKRGSDSGWDYLELPFGYCEELKSKLTLLEIQTDNQKLRHNGVELIRRT